MDGFVEGFTSAFSAEGIGAALGVVLIIAALILIGWGPDRIANEARAFVPTGSNG